MREFIVKVAFILLCKVSKRQKIMDERYKKYLIKQMGKTQI